MAPAKMFVDSIARLDGEEREPSDPWKALGPQFESLFGDITGNLELLKSLYEPGRVREWDNEFIPANLFKYPPAAVDELLEKGTEAELQDLLQRDACIYLISPIGRGKSTYIHYQLKIAVPERLPRIRVVPIIFDVRKCTSPLAFEPLIAQFIGEEIDRAFSCFSIQTDELAEGATHAALCEVFAEDLRRAGLPGTFVDHAKDQGVHQDQRRVIARLREKDPLGFDAKRLGYTRSIEPNTLVVLVVDNMDQHLPFPHGDEIIRDSHAIAARLECPLIVTLRDTSFRKNNPAFATAPYAVRYLALSHSPAQKLLGQRLNRAKALAGPHPDLRRFVNAIASHLRLQSGSQRDRISTLVEEWLDPMSNRNRRELLDLMKSVVSSLHLTSSTFERNRPSKNDYVNADFEVAIAKLKMAMLLGRHAYYADDAYRMSAVNLFRDHRPDRVCRPLIRLKILQHIYLHHHDGVTVETVVSRCTSVLGSAAYATVLGAMRTLVEKGLAVLYGDSDGFESLLLRSPIEIEKLLERRLFVSLNGVFHLEVLVKDDIYLDEMKYATPLPPVVYDEVFRHYFAGQWPNFRTYRQTSTQKFLEFLMACENDDATRRLAAALGVGAVIPGAVAAYEEVVRSMDSHADLQARGRRR